ncbi:MFS transporter [Herbaspirillum robiniae]|nr:MFS transporter [Herbaspirillum robiniae]
MSSGSEPAPSLLRDISYGLLGAPLAMAALPLFVQLPAYYANHVGVALAPLGWILFSARLFDMMQDPLLGYWLDRRRTAQKKWMIVAGIILACTFAGLWKPPSPSQEGAGQVLVLCWLALMLIMAYGAHSLISIAYLSWGARLPGGGLRAVGWREGAGLAGVLLASVIPPYLMANGVSALTQGLSAYCLSFAALLIVCLAMLIRQPQPISLQAPAQPWYAILRQLYSNAHLRRLVWPYALNALSMAIPATLALFFIEDQLQASSMAGVFLASYFLAAAGGLPFWILLARKTSLVQSWRYAMALSILGFLGAFFLNADSAPLYFVICIITGVALGADLALPPVLVGRMPGQEEVIGITYGLFTMLGKLAMSLASLILPVLSACGYESGRGSSSALLVTYAVVPCFLKGIALFMLSRRHWQEN